MVHHNDKPIFIEIYILFHFPSSMIIRFGQARDPFDLEFAEMTKHQEVKGDGFFSRCTF